MSGDWLRVPVGPSAAGWTTRDAARDVLAIVHNVTSATRLLDVVALFDSDPRVQVVFTWTRSSPFAHDVEAFLADIGAMVMPWEQALATEFHLAISASYGGDLKNVRAPLLVVSHGMGYNKYLKAGKRESGKAGKRESGKVFGLSDEWLLHDGELIPSTIVLSHSEQLARLRRDCPEAVPAALVAGDPCFDRMSASAPHRRRYRDAFGVDADTKLVVVTSTWGPHSLLGRHDGLLSRLLAELPMDEYRVAAVLHPNIWHGHGPWQVRTWLASCRRAGLALLPPRDGWRAALVAADLVIGDHGSVTFYGAALGRPVLLGAFPTDDIDPASPVAALGRAAPRLRAGRSLRPQVDRAMDEHTADRHADLAALTTSAPGESARLLRAELYRLMRLAEPAAPAPVLRVPEPPTPPADVVTASLVVARHQGEAIRLSRHPAAVALDGPRMPSGAHLAVDESEPEERLLELADVVYRRRARPNRPARAWSTETLARYSGCLLAAAQMAPGETRIALRTGTTVRVTGDVPDLVDVHASAVYGMLTAGGLDHPVERTVMLGNARHSIAVEPDGPLTRGR